MVQDGYIPMFGACGFIVQEAITSASKFDTQNLVLTMLYIDCYLLYNKEPQLTFSHYLGSLISSSTNLFE